MFIILKILKIFIKELFNFFSLFLKNSSPFIIKIYRILINTNNNLKSLNFYLKKVIFIL